MRPCRSWANPRRRGRWLLGTSERLLGLPLSRAGLCRDCHLAFRKPCRKEGAAWRSTGNDGTIHCRGAQRGHSRQQDCSFAEPRVSSIVEIRSGYGARCIVVDRRLFGRDENAAAFFTSERFISRVAISYSSGCTSSCIFATIRGSDERAAAAARAC